MIVNDELFGKRVIVKLGTGDVMGKGEIVGYVDKPMLLVRYPDGRTIHWVADLCEIDES